MLRGSGRKEAPWASAAQAGASLAGWGVVRVSNMPLERAPTPNVGWMAIGQAVAPRTSESTGRPRRPREAERHRPGRLATSQMPSVKLYRVAVSTAGDLRFGPRFINMRHLARSPRARPAC